MMPACRQTGNPHVADYYNIVFSFAELASLGCVFKFMWVSSVIKFSYIEVSKINIYIPAGFRFWINTPEMISNNPAGVV